MSTNRETQQNVIYTDKKRVSCDGGGGALGHPRVFMDMGPHDFVVCKYCDRKYVYKPGPSA